ncbi:hypothetical protein QYM36_015644 [Artemia franciscana]|uniref:Phosphatidic acid phosphatase type 2/haloperoxidase domain-containing protein n=1 Tax=Artemia franciscana TaxID=6661 RepID=A0AA88L0B2_ARTSF|nr:hypothetical protein QYM36_015644 [Artemia franciscana]
MHDLSPIHKMKYLKEALTYLHDPATVAELQTFFGIRINPRRNSEAGSESCKNSEPDHGSCQEKKEDKQTRQNQILKEIGESNAEYSIGNKFWYYLFFISTSCGDEIFYASMIPFWFWNVDGAVGRRIVSIWMLSMYIGQCLKDVVQLPRPRCPPAARLLKTQVEEYGMPSTHALVAATVPATILFFTSHRYEYRVWVAFVIGILWCFMICLSRIYMGMHSILDVLGGISLAVLMLPILLPLVDWLDSFLLTHPSSPIVILVTSITMLILAPESATLVTKEDTTVIVGSFSGLQIGMWFLFAIGQIQGPPLEPPHTILWPSESQLLLMLLRTLFGLMLGFLAREIGKSLSIKFMKI